MTIKIKFDCKGSSSPAYSCSEPGNNSGVYVQATDYDTLVEQNKALREALVKAQQDINWMTNEGKLLQRFVFEYIDDALTQTGETND